MAQSQFDLVRRHVQKAEEKLLGGLWEKIVNMFDGMDKEAYEAGRKAYHDSLKYLKEHPGADDEKTARMRSQVLEFVRRKYYGAIKRIKSYLANGVREIIDASDPMYEVDIAKFNEALPMLEREIAAASPDEIGKMYLSHCDDKMFVRLLVLAAMKDDDKAEALEKARKKLFSAYAAHRVQKIKGNLETIENMKDVFLYDTQALTEQLADGGDIWEHMTFVSWKDIENHNMANLPEYFWELSRSEHKE